MHREECLDTCKFVQLSVFDPIRRCRKQANETLTLIENESKIVLGCFNASLASHPPTYHRLIDLTSRPGPISLAYDIVSPASSFNDQLEVSNGRTAATSTAFWRSSIGLVSSGRGRVDFGKVVVSFEGGTKADGCVEMSQGVRRFARSCVKSDNNIRSVPEPEKQERKGRWVQKAYPEKAWRD